MDYARKAGMQTGDKIVSIDSIPITCFSQLTELLSAHKEGQVWVTVERKNESVTMPVQVDKKGRIGFEPTAKYYSYDSTRYTLGKSISYGTRDAFEVFYFQAISIWRIMRGDIPARDAVSSPISIAQLFAPKWDWASFWMLTALLSMVLAFMNLLPIPALDGGHILFIGIESIIGRRLSDTFMERAQVVGMIMLLALMVFAVGNDVLKMIGL